MNKYLRIYIGMVFTVGLTILLFGLLLPLLVSSQHDLGFSLAVIIAVSYFPTAFVLLRWTFTTPKLQLQKETSTNV